jgi:hypothetical protein
MGGPHYHKIDERAGNLAFVRQSVLAIDFNRIKSERRVPYRGGGFFLHHRRRHHACLLTSPGKDNEKDFKSVVQGLKNKR